MEDNMKNLSLICLVAASLVATQVLAGNLTVNGNLTVTTNLTAPSITLGGVTQTSWPAALAFGYQGAKYVIVAEGTNDLERGSNLQAAYSTATTLGPTASNRVVVLVPPGSYNLGATSLVMNTSYVDLIGLVPAQMTSKQVFTDSAGITRTKTVANVQCPVLIYSSGSAGTLKQNVDYVRIESLILNNTSSGLAYNPSVYGTNTVLRHVSISSMYDLDYDGEYIDCVGGDSSFSYDGNANGTFIDCVAGDSSFSGNNVASGTFIGCTGGDACFGGWNVASGTFIDCVGGDYTFGANNYASGTFIGCVGGLDSLGGNGAEASGTFIECTGAENSFGGPGGLASGTFIHCVGGTGSFGEVSGTFTDCVGGTNSFGTLDSTAKLQHCQGDPGSFGRFNMASQDFNYNVGGTNTFLMLPQLPTSTNGLPSGTVYNSSGTLKVMP
jgi:hypothetical protein